MWKLKREQKLQNKRLEEISALFNELVHSNVQTTELLNHCGEVGIITESEQKTELQLEIEELCNYRAKLLDEIDFLERKRQSLQIPPVDTPEDENNELSQFPQLQKEPITENGAPSSNGTRKSKRISPLMALNELIRQ